MTKYPKFVKSHPKVNELFDQLSHSDTNDQIVYRANVRTFGELVIIFNVSQYNISEKTLVLDFEINEFKIEIHTIYSTRCGWTIFVFGSGKNGAADRYFSQTILKDPAFLPKPLETYKTETANIAECVLIFATFPPDAKTINVAEAIFELFRCFEEFKSKNNIPDYH